MKNFGRYLKKHSFGLSCSYLTNLQWLKNALRGEAVHEKKSELNATFLFNAHPQNNKISEYYRYVRKELNKKIHNNMHLCMICLFQCMFYVVGSFILRTLDHTSTTFCHFGDIHY